MLCTIYEVTFKPLKNAQIYITTIYIVTPISSRESVYQVNGDCSHFYLSLCMLKHFNLLLVYTPETQVEKDCRSEQNACQAGIQDYQMGILGERSEGHGEEGANSGHGDREGIDDRAHALRCLIIRMFRARGETEHLRHSTNRVYGHLQKHGDVVGEASVIRSWTVEGFIVAGPRVVNQLL